MQILFLMTGLQHTQGIQRDKGNFQVKENLRKTQEILINFLNLRETQVGFDFS